MTTKGFTTKKINRDYDVTETGKTGEQTGMWIRSVLLSTKPSSNLAVGNALV